MQGNNSPDPRPLLPRGATLSPQDAHFNITQLSITDDALSYELSNMSQNVAEIKGIRRPRIACPRENGRGRSLPNG